MVDNHSIVNVDRCIGCGLCAHPCHENARSLERAELRKVFIPALKIVEID